MLGAATSRTAAPPDVVFAPMPALSAGVVAAGEARRYGVRYVLGVQDLIGPGLRQSGIPHGGPLASAATFIEYGVARGAGAVIIPAPRFAGYLAAGGVNVSRVHVVKNWARQRVNSTDRNAARVAFGWPLQTQVVMHTGTIGNKQGLGQLVPAAKEAAKHGTPLIFAIIGNGTRRGELEVAASGLPTLRLYDLQPDDRYASVLAAADVLLVSERPEVSDMSLPSKLTEYFRAGKPIVAFVARDGATADEVRQSGAGVVVPAGDSSELLATLQRLRNEPVWARGLARNGVAYATDALDRAKALSNYEAILMRCAQAPGSPTPVDVG